MKFALMQPYFFPYLGYFELIERVDRWIVFDTAQYTPQSWMNRNRVAHDKSDWSYVTVPVRHAPQGTPIKDIRLADPDTVQKRVIDKLTPYRGHAPHYESVKQLVAEGIAARDSDYLVDLNESTLAKVCDRLGIAFEPERLSQMGLDLGGANEPGDWALQVALAIKADGYLNAPGGRALFKMQDWEMRGIALEFGEMREIQYDRGRFNTVPNLSIIDVLMWNSVERVRSWLHVAAPEAQRVPSGHRLPTE
jgi:hypothetical protein